jgi:hypothetical protein
MVGRGIPELRGDVLHWAGLETSLLSELARRTRGRSLAELAKLPERIVNARNQPVLLPTGGAFQPSARAEDIWLLAGPRRLKYADALTVSPYPRGSGKPSHVALTTVGQYKFRTAIRKLPGQVEADPVRLVDADLLEFTLNGEPHRFRPDQLVFTSPNGAIDINRYAVTHAASIAHGTPRPIYVSDPEVLLGGATPQLTPFVTRGGAARGVLIELNVDSRLPISITEIILGRQR